MEIYLDLDSKSPGLSVRSHQGGGPADTKNWLEAAAYIHRATALIFEAAARGDFDISKWAVCASLDHERITLEYCDDVTPKDRADVRAVLSAVARMTSKKVAVAKSKVRCIDCGADGELTGHQECQYPGRYSEGAR